MAKIYKITAYIVDPNGRYEDAEECYKDLIDGSEVYTPVPIKHQMAKFDVYSLQYHIVWAIKYRKPIFIGEIETDIRNYLLETLKSLDMNIIAMEIMPDHIHLLVNCSPQHYIPDIIKALKGVSARLLMKEFGEELKRKLWGGHLWNPSYFVATASENTEEQIRKYIQNQKRK